ncbi:polymorphic toxin-type HINT domain-containing protein [Lentzea sp. BCCO 10_0061]|uniref:Polymorphic toxin-type HINT domain-containing protein n=1 Tax=Lentzea sokolovensis TaxID=3095429 RepID=A0ABU4VE99_9PSEU|nr:polymorphic toxin-type HINT domain-containing protein [Lentzea sp. BCCO 10_0061]MDX8149509.1 polymorphic toxin-type HINT domain-containing protein [Lentzea sp. BCCO 10_0061]
MAKNTVTATEASPSGGAIMALAAATSSGSGTYKATSLSPSATWSAGSNTGAFTWNYPLRMPPSLGGPTPSLALEYSSASVDGRMAASNNQPSWIGEGFEFGSNFIERRYVSCADDRQDSARNTEETGDLCWRNENATLSMQGHSGELIKESETSKRWRLRNDDGTRVEFGVNANNGTRNGEHWVVTTADGTQHWFGRSAQSVLSVPVAGNHATEPCAVTLFKDSFCSQPYRWNLEYVVDLHGNTMTYSYDKETNKYARNNSVTDLAEYDRASVLKQIDYGTRSDRTETAPMQVVFEPADRCLADCGTKDATHWPDTPWDMECTTSPCRVGSPTFWTTKRLASVTTKTGGNPVEKWTLGQSFPDPGDGTRAGLWLDKISRVGLVGGETPVPDVRFRGEQRSNRVDTHSDQLAAMKWWRLKTIFTETGGQIDVTYADADCVAGSRTPNVNALQDNNLRCYPVRWKPEGNKDPIWDFFHKYVVKSVQEADLTGGSIRVVTDYEYIGNPAWRHVDDDGLTKAEYMTWSVWRGYGAVKTRKGDAEEQTLTEKRYFRGMNGDKLPSGTRLASMPAIAVGDISEAVDEDAFAGMVREEIVYNGDAEVSATVSVPWQSNPTASRTINNATVHARFSSVAGKHTRVALDGGRGYRTTSSVTEFDQTYGMATHSESRGDDKVTGDEKCTLITYARNTSAWVIGTVSQKRDYLVDCARAKTQVGLRDADIAGDVKTYYDGQGYGAAPTKGEPSTIESLKSYVNGAPAYVTDQVTERDIYGRTTKTTDPKGTSTVAYTPAAGGPVTELTATNSVGWVTKTVLQPAWGSPLSVVDPNERKTDYGYDGLGRTTAVWPIGFDRTGPAAKKFSYRDRADGAVAVATSTLNTSLQYVTSYQLFDGLLRPRQTQTPDAAGGTSNTVITDVHYDSAGRVKRANNAYLANTAPGTDLFKPTAAIPSASTTTYDGAGREIVQMLKTDVPVGSPGGNELFRTSTYYAGDRTDVTPPAGGIVSSTLVDVLGRKTELRQYHSGVAAGSATGFDATKYTYDLNDQLTEVAHPSGKKWQYTYDLRGRQTRAVDPDKGITESAYDDADQLASTKDGLGKTLAYVYDTLGRKTSIRDDSSTGTARAEWFYDTLADGDIVKGVLVKSVRHAEHGQYIKENTRFNAAYMPLATDITIPDQETGLGGTYSYASNYFANGTLNVTHLPATGDLKKESLEYGYDALDQPSTQKTAYGVSAPTELVAGTGYTSFGELASTTMLGSGRSVTVVRNYEQYTRRLSGIHTSKQAGPTDVAKVSYSYDPAGNVTRVADSISGDTQCFTTDYLRRLAEAWTPSSGNCNDERTNIGLGGPSKYWQSFTYNISGDREKLVEHVTSAGERKTEYTPTPGKHSLASTVTTDNAGSRMASYTYDAAGNTLTRPSPSGSTQTMTWDREGRVATSADESGASSYIYDADGTRLVRRDPTGSTLYLPGQELRYTKAGGAKTCTRYYTHAGQTIAMRTSTGLTWMSSDQHGTAQHTINALNQQTVSTRRTLPFGEVRGTTGTWPARLDKGLVGGTLDNTGLTHIGAREYDPATGRFVSVDPVMDTSDPQQWNGYAYANNSPITYSDPTGLYATSCMNDGSNCSTHHTKDHAVAPSGPTQEWVTSEETGISVAYNTTTNKSYIGDYELPVDSPNIFDIGREMRSIRTAMGKDMPEGEDLDGSYSAHQLLFLATKACTERKSLGCSGRLINALGAAMGFAVGLGSDALGHQLASGRPGGPSVPLPGSARPAYRKGCGSNSFLPETLVLMSDGSTKRIDEVNVGDQVAAADPESGESGAREVVATIIGEGIKHLVEIEIETSDGKVTATQQHPFWLPDQERWVDAQELRPGSVLQTSAGALVQVTAIKKRAAIKRVHNLTVDDFHTYYVLAGDTPVLVHNDGGIYSWPNTDGPIPQRGQTALYAQFSQRTGEFLKWGVWTNTTGNYSRYTQKYLKTQGIQTTVLRNFDSKDAAHAVESDLIARAPGPHNHERYAGSKSTGENPLDIIRRFGYRGGPAC